MKLTAKKVESTKDPGMYGDGAGLYLRCGPTGAKSWILRATFQNKKLDQTSKSNRVDFGLGSTSVLSLREARDKAQDWRKLIKQGVDPRKRQEATLVTFEQAARQKHQELVPTFRSEKHQQKWIRSLEQYAFPRIGALPIAVVGSSEVLGVLSPIWVDKNDTAKRVLQRMRSVFDWAKAKKLYSDENPTNTASAALPRVKQDVRNMPALPWQDLPEFLRRLRQREGVSARALEFLVLTAARPGEVRGAAWAEIEGETWVRPAERMKTGKEHRVPLCAEALEVLHAMRGLDKTLVFPSPNKPYGSTVKPLSDAVFQRLIGRMGVSGISAHGFRTTFRTWCSDRTNVPREVAEAALAHAVGDKVEQAYARSDMYEKRVALMARWAAFCGGDSGSVVRFSTL